MKFIKRLVIILLLIFLIACAPKTIKIDEELEDTNEPIEEKVLNQSLFNGSTIELDKKEFQAFGIMISNSREARPQSALGLADIVYEIAVETYSITRFLAIFASNHPDKVGPVRSARVPFVRLIQEWSLPFAHYGSAEIGQGDALSLLQQIKPPIRFDGHKGINNEFYFRSTDRKAPHNAYFNSEKALLKIPELEYEHHFDFDEETNVSGEQVYKLSLRYSSYTPVKYEYDRQTNKYKRFIHNEPMMDAYTNEQISVTNIIVQHAPHTMVESVHYVLVDFLGDGKAEFYINGQYEEGTWKKESFTSATQFFNSKGEPVVLSPGNTWIQIVHPKVEITRE